MIARQGEMLANRVKKRFAYLSKKFFRENIEAFRLYDWDIPEIRAVVDWYAGHIVIAEYTRTQSPEEWLPAMAEFVAKALGIQVENVHIKRRRTAAGDEPRYRRLGRKGQGMVVRERDMRFRVNLTDFIDTGLFPDHRNTREIVRRESKDRDFLNLFCYSGAFTCYAASGGARATVSVDRSETAVKWARDNLDLNGLTASVHEFVQSDVFEF
ncbi:MAG: class I SAM-dependent methyltransferase, partial [Deltaproteobacteria bacterium]|nr:class I SAM-dependent methyltransferase [Deltaproteobacteria bacterium]